MTGEPADLDPSAARPSLPELLRALDSIRDRLTRLERAGSTGVVRDGGEPSTVAIVQEILSIPSMGLDPGELFTLAMDRASRLLAADRTMLFVAERAGGRLVPRAAHGFRREDLDSISVRPGEGMVGTVFAERRVLAHPPYGDGEPHDAFIERFPVEVAVAVPVRAEDEVAGVLFVGRRRLDVPFSADEILLLLVIADRVAGGLVHQGLLDRQARHVARLGMLRAFGAEALSPLPLHDVLARACETGSELVGVRAAAIALTGASGDLELAAARGLPGPIERWRHVSAREGLTAELDVGSAPLSCRDVQAREAAERSFLGDGGFHGCLLLPLLSRGARLGVLYLADTEVRDFPAEEVEAARVLATLTAAAIDGGRASRELWDALDRARASGERAIETEKTRAVGELAGGLARELGAVFAAILGKARLLLARAPDEPSREGLGVIEEAAWRGADVVDRLIALAGPAADETAQMVDVVGLLHDIVAAAWPGGVEAPPARVDVVTELAPAPLVRGSTVALRDALGNILRNALDAMPQGGRLTVATRTRDDGVEIVVEDTGEGIAADASRRVFDAFYTTRSASRMGLGLTVAHGAITRHGGRIEIASAPGGGTRVTIWLPAAEGRASETIPAREPAPVIAGPLDGAGHAREPAVSSRPPATPDGGAASPPPHGHAGPAAAAPAILVIEDEASVRSLLVSALVAAGYAVETAADEPSGLAKLEHARFDVVLADLALPQRSGLAVAESVKRLAPRTPVVLIAGWGHVLDPERLREHGVDLMLVKPFRLERVLSVVSDALRLRACA